MYLRARVLPVNPNSPQQQEVREAVGTLSNRWNQNLSEAERQSWRDYAFNTPVTNAMGDSIKLSGINMYTRANAPRIQAGLAIIDSGPNIYDSSPTPTAVAPTFTDGIALTASGGDPSLITDFALLYVSRPQNPGIGFFKGPYRFVASDALTTVGAIAFAAIPYPFTADQGQLVFFRLQITRADGRLSGSAYGGAIVEAS